MSGSVTEESLKRKRSKVPEKANKRAKPKDSDEHDPQAEILQLENEILESKKNYNNITILLDLAQKDGDDDSTQLAVVSLCRVFLRLFASGNLARRNGQSEKDIVVVQWLKKRLGDFKQIILSELGQEDTASTALTLAMRILQAEGKHTNDKDEYSFPKGFLREVVEALILSESEEIREEFCEKFLGEYADIRFYTFKALKYVVDSCLTCV